MNAARLSTVAKPLTAGAMAVVLAVGMVPATAGPALAAHDTNITQGQFSVYAATGTLEVTGTVNQNEARNLINEVHNHGNPGIRWDAGLENAALQRAAELSLYFSTVRPNGAYMSSLVPSFGTGSSSGQCIAAGPTSAASVYGQWANSSEYAGNLTNKSNTLMGAAMFTVNGQAYWVALFSSSGSTSGVSTTASNGTQTVKIPVSSDNLNLSLEGGFAANASMGARTQLKVVNANKGLSSSRTTIDAGCFNWSSSDAATVSVDRSGTATALKLGGATITAAAKSGSISVSTAVQIGSANQMHRLYNPNSGEHFYTADTNERDHLKQVGWRYEGVGWEAPRAGDPVYRLYNPNAGDHHYTTSVVERDHLRSEGWTYEGVGWSTDNGKAVPLHRLYNPNAKAGAHHYTTSATESNMLRGIGWRYEGIGWYGVK